MDEIRVKHQADMERNPCEQQIAKQDATDGIQDRRITNMEEDISNLVSEVVLLREGAK